MYWISFRPKREFCKIDPWRRADFLQPSVWQEEYEDDDENGEKSPAANVFEEAAWPRDLHREAL
jgi:hypothetical protein